jgi:hypothetical protein
MKLAVHHLSVAGVAALVGILGTGCGSSEGSPGAAVDPTASTSLDLQVHRLPTLPDPSLAVPAGNELAFVLDGVGVQIYACQATTTGAPAWVFQAPQATLFEACGRVAGKHFAGPTWEANDGSTVVGAKIAAFTVDPANIPWLLLQAASNTGDGRMSDVTFVQRLQTAGGIAPATGCDADHIGDVANVDYTAKYYFYRATDGD